MKKNAPRGSPCGGREFCRRSDPPQAEKLASELLCSRKLRPVKQELSDRSERADFLCIPGTSGIAGK